jgi:hypothetical protein
MERERMDNRLKATVWLVNGGRITGFMYDDPVIALYDAQYLRPGANMAEPKARPQDLVTVPTESVLFIHWHGFDPERTSA